MVVPAIQSAITGLVVGVLGGSVASAAGAERPVAVGVVVGGVVLTGVWILALSDRRRLLWELETITRADLDGDGVTGEPEREPLRLAYVHDAGRHRRLHAAADLRYFLREAYSERGTTWRAWEGTRLPSGREVTRLVWERFNQMLLNAGLARRPYPTAELELQSTYQQALGAFRELL